METDPVKMSVGGMRAHLARRTFHLSMAFLPWLFHEHGNDIGEQIGITKEKFVSIVIILAIIGESIRLKMGLVVFGQREYEAEQISALAWGGFSVGLVLLMFPEPEFGYPLILSLVFIDPLLGESRRMGLSDSKVYITGGIGAFIIWLACYQLIHTPLMLVFLMSPLVVIAERPRLKWIDDNATMLLIPAAALLIVSPWL